MARHNLRDRISAGRGRSPWWRLALGIAPLLALWLAGCAPSATSIFNQAASVPEDAVLALTYFTSTGTGVMGVRAKDGASLWHTATGNINWDPVLVGGTLYAVEAQMSEDQRIAAVRLADGKVLWTAPIPQSKTGYNEYVAADATTVVATTGSLDGLVAYDPLSGQPRWRVPLRVAGQPFVWKGNVYVYAVPENDVGPVMITALRGTDGAVLWRTPISPNYRGGMAANATALLVAGGDGAVVALRLSDGQALWHGPRMENTTLEPVATDEIVLATDGALVGLDAHTGAQLWRATPHGERVWTKPALAPDTLPSAGGLTFVGTSHGLSAIRLWDGGEAWRVSFSGPSFVIGGTVYVYQKALTNCYHECSAKLAAYDGATGRLFWKRSLANVSLLARPAPGETA